MENTQTMSDIMQTIQQRIDLLKESAIHQQTKMKDTLNERIIQSEIIQNQLSDNQQKLTAELGSSKATLLDLAQGLQLDFSVEITEFEQACQNETADKIELTKQLEQDVQEKISSQLNELKDKTNVALQKIDNIVLHIQQSFGKQEKTNTRILEKLKQFLYKHFDKQIITSKEYLAKQLERGANKLRA